MGSELCSSVVRALKKGRYKVANMVVNFALIILVREAGRFI